MVYNGKSLRWFRGTPISGNLHIVLYYRSLIPNFHVNREILALEIIQVTRNHWTSTQPKLLLYPFRFDQPRPFLQGDGEGANENWWIIGFHTVNHDKLNRYQSHWATNRNISGIWCIYYLVVNYPRIVIRWERFTPVKFTWTTCPHKNPIYNQGCNPLTIRGMSHQVENTIPKLRGGW